MPRTTARKLVVVEWTDSHSGDGWQPLDAIAAASEPIYCRSVGWLASRTDDTTVLVSSISGERNGNVRLFGRGDIAIPNKAIVKMNFACLMHAAVWGPRDGKVRVHDHWPEHDYGCECYQPRSEAP